MNEQTLWLATYWNGNETDWTHFISNKDDRKLAYKNGLKHLIDEEFIWDEQSDHMLQVYEIDKVWGRDIILS